MQEIIGAGCKQNDMDMGIFCSSNESNEVLQVKRGRKKPNYLIRKTTF